MIIKTYIPLPIDVWQGEANADNNALDIFYLEKNNSKISHGMINSFNEVKGDCIIVIPDIFVSIHSFDLPFNKNTIKALPNLLSERILSPISDVMYKGFKGANGKLFAWVIDKIYYEKIKSWTQNNNSKVHTILPYSCTPDMVKNMVAEHEHLYEMGDEKRNLSALNKVNEWDSNLIKFSKFGMENISQTLKKKTKTFMLIVLLIIGLTSVLAYYGYNNANMTILQKGNLIYKMLMQDSKPRREFAGEYQQLKLINKRFENYKNETAVNDYIYILLKSGGTDMVESYLFDTNKINFVYSAKNKDGAYGLLDELNSDNRFKNIKIEQVEDTLKYKFVMEK